MSFRGGGKNSVIAPVVNCHCYNADGSMVALCPNTKSVLIYKTNKSDDFSKWKLAFKLTEHDQKVTAIDWAPKSNKILTCSEDRNAYVWHLEGKKWKPTLVLVRINRAALCCRWSCEENKFAVGSGAKCVSVCFFGKEQNWWVSNIIKKKFQSSVTTLSWHPNDNTLLATGSTDGKCRVVSTFLKKLDSKDKKKGAFGKVLGEYKCDSWIHDVCFSPDGSLLAYVGHDSAVYVVEQGGEAVKIPHPHLPFKTCLFKDNGTLLCAGFDYAVVTFKGSGGDWNESGKTSGGGAKKKQSSGVRSAFNKFQKSTLTGGRGGTRLKTKHKNIINDLVFVGKNGKKVSSSGIDGRIFFW